MSRRRTVCVALTWLTLHAGPQVSAQPARPHTMPPPGVITFAHELALGGYSRRDIEVLSVAIADFNGDDRLDIAAIGTDPSNRLAVHLNDGMRGFTQVALGDSSSPELLVTGDFDEDGLADLVRGTILLRGLGDGTFAPPESLVREVTLRPEGLVSADLDLDGHLDLAMSHEAPRVEGDESTDPGIDLAVLWGHGDGTFEPLQKVANRRYGFQLRLAADVTSDGRPELIAGIQTWTDGLDDTVLVFLNPGGRDHTLVCETPTSGSTRALAVADLDHDGHADYVVQDRVHRGDGMGAFDPIPSILPVGDVAELSTSKAGTAIVDLDQDGWRDIILRAYPALIVFRNRGDAGFERAGAYRSHGSSNSGAGGLAVGDLDGDGVEDVVAYPHLGVDSTRWSEFSSAGVFFGRPDGTLEGTGFSRPLGPGVANAALDVIAIHLRPDGIADLVQRYAYDSLCLVRNLGSRGFGEPQRLGTGGKVLGVLDLDHDGVDDLVSQSGTSIEVRLGHPVFGLGSASVVGSGRVLAIGAVDGGLGPGLVMVDPTGALSHRPGDGSGGFGPPFSLGASPTFLANDRGKGVSGDIDGDGLEDLVVVAKAPHPGGWDSVRVFHSNGHAPLQSVDAFEFALPDHSDVLAELRLADLDRDGDLDLLVLHADSYYLAFIQVLLNDGVGHFSPLVRYDLGMDDYSGLAVGDLDGDGVLDLVTAHAVDRPGRVTTFRGRGDGTFDRSTHHPEPRAGFGRIAIGRFDADDRLDLVLPAWQQIGLLTLLNVSTPGEVTPVAASLVSASIDDGLARVTWSTDATPGIEALVFRSVDGAAFAVVARLHPDGEGRVRYEDATIAPGHRYGYRLAFAEGGRLVTVSETWLEFPLAASLALAGATPNPVEGDLVVAFSLARRGPGTLGLFDLAGRRVAEHDLTGFAPGAHRVRLTPGGAVAPGLYFIRLVTPERTLTARAVVLR